MDGQPLPEIAAPRLGALRGAVSARPDSEEGRAAVARASELGPASLIRFCAGWDYFDLATGQTDYLSFTRALPWDHAPGALIAREVGLRAARRTGEDYAPGEGASGVLTTHPSVWETVNAELPVKTRGAARG